MTDILAAILWVAIGNAYDARSPLNDEDFLAYNRAQYQLCRILGWS